MGFNRYGGIDTIPVRIKSARWIDRTIVDPDFKMQVGTGGMSGHSGTPDGLPFRDLFPWGDQQFGGMGVQRRHAVAVVDLDRVAVSAALSRAFHGATLRGQDWAALGGAQVKAGVVLGPTIDGVDARAEAAGDVLGPAQIQDGGEPAGGVP